MSSELVNIIDKILDHEKEIRGRLAKVVKNEILNLQVLIDNNWWTY